MPLPQGRAQAEIKRCGAAQCKQTGSMPCDQHFVLTRRLHMLALEDLLIPRNTQCHPKTVCFKGAYDIHCSRQLRFETLPPIQLASSACRHKPQFLNERCSHVQTHGARIETANKGRHTPPAESRCTASTMLHNSNWDASAQCHNNPASSVSPLAYVYYTGGTIGHPVLSAQQLTGREYNKDVKPRHCATAPGQREHYSCKSDPQDQHAAS